MISPAAILAPLLILFGPPSLVGIDDRARLAPLGERAEKAADMRPGWIMFDAVYSDPVQRQVRIEQRVIIRIAPRSAIPRQSLSSLVPAQNSRVRLVEREAGDCLPIAAIGAVQPSRDNRLMFYMRDRRLFTARLERSCSAREFYSGFYIERNADGQLCVDRDRLQSRTGSKCEVEALHQMVAERE